MTTTAIESSKFTSNLSVNDKEQLILCEAKSRTKKYNNIESEIFDRMLSQQKYQRNYIESQRLENLRTNFLSWLFRLSTKTEVSNQTLFNTVFLLDELFSRLKSEAIEDPSNFQLLSIGCFFLSYKVFEKKTMTVRFVEKYLLCGNWGEEDIRRAEIFVLQTVDYNLHTINFYSFFEFYKKIIEKHFNHSEILNKINFLANFTMRQAVLIKEFIFSLSPSEQIRIILNTVFLLLSQLTGLDLSLFESFFVEMISISNRELTEFEKYSNVLISGLKINEEFVEKFTRIH